jgi:hypothetical protein
MKRLLVISTSVAIVAATLSPALATNGKKHLRSYVEPNAYQTTYRGFPDPSFGNRAGINYAKQTGRCVADLGYGRFEYCGW